MFFILLNYSMLLYFTTAFCPNGSVPYFNDQTQCVYFKTTPSYWLEAEEICMNFGGHLTSIHNIFQNMFLSQEGLLNFTKSSNSDFWIGASDLTSAGTWSWMDNTAFDFVDWEKGQPANLSGSDCVAVTMEGGRWSSDDCYKTKPFVCLIKSIVDKTTTTPVPPTTAVWTTTSKPKACPIKWTYYKTTGFCYIAVSNGEYWNGELLCQQYGGHLASIHSEDETLFVSHLAYYHNTGRDSCGSFWIGLYTDDNQKHYKWTDGTLFNFPNWNSNQYCLGAGDLDDNTGVLMLDGTFCLMYHAWPCGYICKKLPS